MSSDNSTIKEQVQIRLLNDSDDLNELTVLLNKAYKRLADRGFHFVASHQGVEITKDRISKGQCFVAVLNGEGIGTILYVRHKRSSGHEWYDRKEVAMFGQFAIDEKFQNAGIGSLLIDHVEQLALSDGAEELSLDTSEGTLDLITFYKKRGYREVGMHKWEEVNYRSVILSKKLK